MKKSDLVDDIKIDHQYVVCIVNGRCLPNWIFEGIVFGPFHTFGELIVYTPTKFCENILIWGRYMLPKRRYMLHVWCIAAVCQIGLSKETCSDHSTPRGSSLPIYPPNFMKIS